MPRTRVGKARHARNLYLQALTLRPGNVVRGLEKEAATTGGTRKVVSGAGTLQTNTIPRGIGTTTNGERGTTNGKIFSPEMPAISNM
jgi:hypothetical protein